jgi:hypothetical protein
MVFLDLDRLKVYSRPPEPFPQKAEDKRAEKRLSFQQRFHVGHKGQREHLVRELRFVIREYHHGFVPLKGLSVL